MKTMVNITPQQSMNRYAEMIRPVWAEIDRAAIRHNMGEIKRFVGPEVAVMAVVKAEGYGHGALAVAREALGSGAAWLGVSLPEEGIALRRAGITAPILVFAPLQTEFAAQVLENDLTTTLCIPEAAVRLAEAARQTGRIPRAHLKVDTGMGRVGVRPEEAVAFLERVKDCGIAVTGVYSHLATADETDKSYALQQVKTFATVVAALKNANLAPECIHLANSAAIIDLPEAHFNMVRPGIILYGLYPSAEVRRERLRLQNALSLKSRVVFVKRVPAGTGISYGQRYHTGRETTVATVPIGYADGWTRLLSHKAQALIHGKKFPVVGTICMDQCMIDVGDEPVALGDEVVLIGRQGEAEISADDVARQLGTINYEITCMLSERVPRIYIDGEK